MTVAYSAQLKCLLWQRLLLSYQMITAASTILPAHALSLTRTCPVQAAAS